MNHKVKKRNAHMSSKLRKVGSEMWSVMAMADLSDSETMVLMEKMTAELVEHGVPPELWEDIMLAFSKRVINEAGDIHMRRSTVH